MLTVKEFEVLIGNSESSTLDFKTTMYDFSDDKDFSKTGKFVKDIVSLCNTIRNETSYIIMGVQENGGQKTLLGLRDIVDDAILQDKIKDKVFPRPNFVFYTLTYDNKVFGILEFPVSKYSTPLYPTVKIKGLDIGRVYYRRGTTNTEAIGYEIITINNWLQGLPDLRNGDSLQEQINDLIKRLTTGVERLSTIIADILLLARRNNLTELIKYCTSELKGIEKSQAVNIQEDLQYRVQTIKVSVAGIEINPYFNGNIIKSEMEKNKDFVDFRMMFSTSISELESHIERFSSTTICTTIKIDSKQLFPDKKEESYNLTGYVFKDNYIGLYRNIRQRTIDTLMSV